MADNKTKYTLVIEYVEGEDRCEYIKESIVSDDDHGEPLNVGTIDLYDYFTDADIACLTEFKIAKS